MAGKTIGVLAPDPETGRMRFATVDEAEADIVVKAGGRVLSKTEGDKQEAQIRQDERAEKAGVGGTIANVAGAISGAVNPLAFQGGPGSTGEAYNRGVTSGLSAGLSDVAVAKTANALSLGAGAKVAQQVDDVKLTSPTAHTAGEIMGFTAGAVGLPASPAGIIGKAGNIVEHGAGLILKGGGGALRQAAVTGGKMAIRGGVEAGITGAIQSGADDVLHDQPINGTKLYTAVGHNALAGALLGGGLGFSGSLAASGAKAAVRGAAARLAQSGAPEGAGAVAAEGGVLKRTSNELAVDALGATKTQVADALEHVKGGKVAVGEYVNRVAIRPPDDASGAIAGTVKAAWTGHPKEILAAVQADKASRIIPGLNDAIGAAPARMHVDELVSMVDAQHGAMLKDPTQIAGADAFKNRIALELQALSNAGKVGADGTVSAADLYRFRASLERRAYEVASTSSAAGQAYKGFLRDLDGRIVDKIDEAAKLAGNTDAGDKIRHWKREYQLASAAEEMATHGADRYGNNNIFGIRESIGAATALASGHPVGAATTLVGGKVLRERGAAAGAYALGRMAESKAVAKLLAAADEAVTKSAAGAFREAEPVAPKSSRAKALPQVTAEEGRAQQRATIAQANGIVKWVGDTKANPQRVLDALQEAGAVVGRAAGSQTSAAYTEATMRAMQFIMRYVPVKERRDPLDPRSVPPLTLEESQRLIRATTYATKPMTVWKDFERGVVTPEGLAAATEFMPDQFADFRAKLLEHVTSHLARGERLSSAQRLRVDKLLGIPGGADLRGPALVQLQANLAPEGPDNSAGPTPAKNTGGGNKPVDMKVQQSGFDSVEARKSG